MTTRLLVAISMVPFATAIADAQTKGLVPDANGVTIEAIDAALERVDNTLELDEATRGRLVDQLRQARSYLRSKQAAEAAAATYAAAVQTAPRETLRLRAKLDDVTLAAPSAESLGVDEQTSTPVLEGMLTNALGQLAAIEAKLLSLETEAAAEADRPPEIRERLAELRAIREESIPEEPVTGEVQALGDARRLAAQLEGEARGSESRSLEQELLSHGVRLNLIGAQRDDAARERVEMRRRVDVLQTAVNGRRQLQADQAQEAAALAELAAADEHPAVRALAEENAGLTRELPAVASEIQRATGRLYQIESEAKGIEQNLAGALKRLELGGVNQVLGRLLVEQQQNLPRVPRQRHEMRERRSALAQVSLAQIQSEEQRRELTPLDGSVDRIMAQIIDVTDPEELLSIRGKVELLLRNRRDLLQQISSSYASQLSALNEVDLAQARLLDAVAEYERFLDRNLLWIPTATFFGPGQVRRIPPAVGWLIRPSSWTATVGALGRALRHSLAGTLGALFALGLALYLRRSLAASEVSIETGPAPHGHGDGDQGAHRTIRQTLDASALVALRALPLPFLMAVLAWALQRSPAPDDFASAVGVALAAAAPLLYSTLLLRGLAADGSVMQTDFGWRPRQLALLHRQATRLAVLGIPLAVITAMAYGAQTTSHAQSLGRLAFVLLMILTGGVAHGLLHPIRGLAAPPEGGAGTHRLLRVAHALAVGMPLLLAGASLLGYSYTALTLAGHLIDTYLLGLGLYFARLLIWRWLTLAGHDLKNTKPDVEGGPLDPEVPETVIGEAQSDPVGSVAEPIMATMDVAPAPPGPDSDTVDRQSKRLVDSGLAFVALVAAWAIWSDVLPALGMLDRTALWPQTAIVDGQETTVPVTLADLLLALLIAGVTFIAAKNLPGLMEITVLHRATLQPGSRYAINTLMRYVIVLIGTIAAFSVIGWNWSRIQWLAAAISFGLGFGLQEIVANFVSGLVILFERPVRVGDTVTVGQVTGTISRVRIRATTITDWDRKEIIVPNKSLITEQVINWTLTDSTTRIVTPVGIAYGSDVEKAQEIMIRTLQRLPLVLADPPPKVYFVGFGESSLDFKLHAYVSQLSDRLPLIHAVHGEILRALEDQGIEIPFPQRDLHVKGSLGPEAGAAVVGASSS
ncbi:MAG: mechanosensitive ion channel domain-containing protein [Acidobacteriota bacterium]